MVFPQPVKDTNSPTLEQIVARAMLRSMKRGSFSDIDRMLDRAIGKATETIEGKLTGKGGIPFVPPIINILPVRVVGKE